MDKQTSKIYQMIHQPLFSIVTVCYNSEKTIARTIESILTQEFKDYEYIIVDGNSKDRTLDILREYEPKFEGRMKIKSEPDKGIYDAFNKGIQRSSGTYVWIVNSDDYIEPKALKELSQLIKSFPNDKLPIISASMNFIDDNKNISRQYYSSEKFCKDAYQTFGMGLVHPATLVPKYIYNRIGYYSTKYKIMADIDWFRRAYKSLQPISFSKAIITNMCYGGVSTASNFPVLYKDRKLLYQMHIKNFIKRNLYILKWILIYFRDSLKNKR